MGYNKKKQKENLWSLKYPLSVDGSLRDKEGKGRTLIDIIPDSKARNPAEILEENIELEAKREQIEEAKAFLKDKKEQYILDALLGKLTDGVPPEGDYNVISDILKNKKTIEVTIDEIKRVIEKVDIFCKCSGIRQRYIKDKTIWLIENAKYWVNIIKNLFKGYNLKELFISESSENVYEMEKEIDKSKKKVDLVILDLCLPKSEDELKKGIETQDEGIRVFLDLRVNPHFKLIPFFIFSQIEREKMRVPEMDIGLCDCLPKGYYTIDAFLTKITRLLMVTGSMSEDVSKNVNGINLLWNKERNELTNTNIDKKIIITEPTFRDIIDLAIDRNIVYLIDLLLITIKNSKTDDSTKKELEKKVEKNKDNIFDLLNKEKNREDSPITKLYDSMRNQLSTLNKKYLGELNIKFAASSKSGEFQLSPKIS